MIYNDTDMTFSDFLALLESNNLEITSAADMLDAKIEGCPTYYYFDNLDGKKYVLLEDEFNFSSVIYEIKKVEEKERPCKIILIDTVGIECAADTLELFDI